MVFSIAMFMQLVGTTAWIHANGLKLGQSWFRRWQILWRDVVQIEPPTASSTWIRCDLVLRSGECLCIDRLRLKPVVGATSHYVNHPDVQAVLDQFAAWQQSHGGGWQR